MCLWLVSQRKLGVPEAVCFDLLEIVIADGWSVRTTRQQRKFVIPGAVCFDLLDPLAPDLLAPDPLAPDLLARFLFKQNGNPSPCHVV